MFRRASLLALPLFVMNCYAAQYSVPNGGIYTSGVIGAAGTSNSRQMREGEACATSYLGWFATGDASIESAASKAGISNIANVSQRGEGILGFYQKICTVVRGN